MRAFVFVLLALVLGAGLLLTAGACGGGGGGAPAPATFAGTYFYNAFAGDPGPPVAWSWWGTVNSDGAGSITGGTLTWNTAGTVNTGPAPPMPYTVTGANRMTWSAATPFEMQGGLAADARVATLTSTAGGSFPGMAVLLRKGGSFNLASLTGPYHVATLYRSGTTMGSMWGTAAFDGAGGVTFTLTANNNGVVAAVPLGAETYTVAPDGTTTVTLGGQTFRGGILAGSELAALAGTTNPSAPTLLMLLIRASTTASTATFTGSYHVTFMVAAFGGPPHWSSVTGLGSSDGIGTLTIPAGALVNTDGTITPLPTPSTGPYLVVPNGQLSVSGSLQGAVSPTGDFAMLSGRTTGGSSPNLWFFVR